MARAKRASLFDKISMDEALPSLISEMTDLYLSDEAPWVVGYSGGKDSTAVLQLVWTAISKLGPKAKKPVHVISTDTLVENPVVAAWVANSLRKINEAAKALDLPISAHRLMPELTDSFWVNLIGKGYAAPRPKFRWCTSRLKIQPSHKFISSVVDNHGEAILVLGIRKAESAVRARNMERHEAKRTKARLSPNGSLQNSLIYSPIEDWSNDDVWMYVLENPNPWGHDNYELFEMYKGASEDGECPLVVSSNTPSCGDSRFGCWVCTLVEKDRSMQAMIRNDEDKEWMLPLLEIRNEIDFRNMSENGDRHLRDFRRMSGKVQLFHGSPIPGPYKQEMREHLLNKLLKTQAHVRKVGPAFVKNIELINPAELEEIRRIWVMDKHELEDNVPKIYMEATGEPYPGHAIDENTQFHAAEMKILADICNGDQMQYEMLRELISIELRQRNSLKRTNLFSDLEKAIRRSFYDGADDARAHAMVKASKLTTDFGSDDTRNRKIAWLATDDS